MVGIERIPPPGRLIIGVLFGGEGDISTAERLVSLLYGPVFRRSNTVPFRTFSDHYEREMGKEINRCFWAFKPPFPRGALAEAKLGTNRIERRLAREGNRGINLDPGLLTPEALILATTKPHYHRIYLSKGIYGELTLLYQRKEFDVMPWTYPDYREQWARSFFKGVRDELLDCE